MIPPKVKSGDILKRIRSYHDDIGPALRSNIMEMPDGTNIRVYDLTPNPLNLSKHPDASRYQYYIQIIPWKKKFIGIVGARSPEPPDGDGLRRIFYCESTDLINWTNMRPILEPIPNTGFSNTVVDPYVIRDRNRWIMWFTGEDANNIGTWQVFCATFDDDFNIINYTSNPVIPQNATGTGLDSPSTDASEYIRIGRNTYYGIYLGGSGNQRAFGTIIEGDPLDNNAYDVIGELSFDQIPTPTYYVEGLRPMYDGKNVWWLRATQQSAYPDIYIYSTDDMLNFSLVGTLISAHPNTWRNNLVASCAIYYGGRWIVSYSATQSPTYEVSGANETYRCGIAIVEVIN